MLVKITQGLLEGREDTSLTSGKVFYSFLGIPYAEPPVGELRFQPPVPARGWSSVRNAKYDRNRAYEVLDPESLDHRTVESEDCLYVNVFTPEPPNANAPLKPVIVHIHGGGYHFGTGNMDCVSADHLANYDVVMVSINYRLHLLGFLNLNTPSCRGNCGSKDQVLALQWVKDNIRFFGGDPDNVTINGPSSGGNSVHLLTISPLAKGLFHKAIVESGTIIGPWIHDDQVEVGFKIGRKLGFAGTDAEELVKFLKTQSAKTLCEEVNILIASQKESLPFAIRGTMIFGPSIEKFTENAFLPDYPINLISTSQPIPILAGVAEKEGVSVLFGLEKKESLFAHLKRNFADLVKYNVPCHPSKVSEISEKVKDYYLHSLGDDASAEEIKEKIIEIYSHLYFMNFYDVNEKTTKAAAPFYAYKFAYVGGLNLSVEWKMNISGALHADELEYITPARGLHRDGIPANKTDSRVIDNLCTAWTNFARTSNPNPLPDNKVHWNPYTRDDPSYMLFTEKCVSMQGVIWKDELEFWKRIFHTYTDWSDPKSRRVQL